MADAGKKSKYSSTSLVPMFNIYCIFIKLMADVGKGASHGAPTAEVLNLRCSGPGSVARFVSTLSFQRTICAIRGAFRSRPVTRMLEY